METEPNILSSIYASNEVAQIRRDVSRVVQRSSNGVLTLVKQHGWVGVPLESSYHFSAADEAQLLRAIQEYPHSQYMWAVALESLNEFPPAFAVPMTAAGIRAFNHQCSHFNFALFPDGLSWIVICTTDEYFIVAGPPKFVETVVGSGLDQAFKQFHIFAASPEWPQAISNFLLSVLMSLRYEYMQASAGMAVRLGPDNNLLPQEGGTQFLGPTLGKDAGDV